MMHNNPTCSNSPGLALSRWLSSSFISSLSSSVWFWLSWSQLQPQVGIRPTGPSAWQSSIVWGVNYSSSVFCSFGVPKLDRTIWRVTSFSNFLFYLDSASCCQKKQVGGEKYTLLPAREAHVSYGCSSSCVYEKENVPGSRFCFRAGTLQAVCLGNAFDGLIF